MSRPHLLRPMAFYGHDDALYVAIRLLDILAEGDRPLAAWHDDMVPMLNTPELRFDCPDEEKFDAVAEVKANLRNEGADVNAIDGVRVSTADGWWLLRASNTQAVLVARAEARDQEGLERLKAENRASSECRRRRAGRISKRSDMSGIGRTCRRRDRSPHMSDPTLTRTILPNRSDFWAKWLGRPQQNRIPGVSRTQDE